MNRRIKLTGLLLCAASGLMAQEKYELNSGWKSHPAKDVKVNGATLSTPGYAVGSWEPATVPGTVLATLVENKKVADPFYGMNNKNIPDIYHTGADYYTWWFVKDFNEARPDADGQVWLNFRGVNDGCDIYLNGQKVNAATHRGAYLRQTYNITRLLNKDGKNRLAVIVFPGLNPGNPNGGQGGDGTIARNVGPQYTAGWDWIQPMRDRNTGIWDKVTIEKTGAVRIKDPHVVTIVPGTRMPQGIQQPATIKVAATLENAAATNVTGQLKYVLNGKSIQQTVTLAPQAVTTIQLPDFQLENPSLWWPAGYGPQNLYQLPLEFVANGKTSDKLSVEFGVREIQTSWNTYTRSREVKVNGQRIFIKGGNWITSDAMFRFSKERYDAEIRFHRDMNLNLIRIWGGSLTERPEFFEACDKYGLLVFQDFWMSGDCNGRWLDPQKKEDQWVRRQYPDDHQLFIASVADQVKMLRNYPSLAFWCGGNEITPPQDILAAMKDSILPALDGTRYFFDYSNTDSMSYNFIGGNGDGPYGIQTVAHFWADRTFPFNSEVGSVGVGDYASLERFLPEANRVAPTEGDKQVDSVWEYHKYIGYGKSIAPYGAARNLEDWANKAQLVNYDQYRALMEGFSAHMWDWYTGVIIWKTQNPWTALRGQMYDYYLDPNACLYGLHSGSKPLHAMYNPVDKQIMVVNNTFEFHRDLMLEWVAYDMDGKPHDLGMQFLEATPSSVQRHLDIKAMVEKNGNSKGMFLSLRLLNLEKEVIDDNFYWLPDASGNYSGLQELQRVSPTITAVRKNDEVVVTLTNAANGPVAFFNRVSLVNKADKKRILPVFYSDNYISVLPGESKTITISGDRVKAAKDAVVEVFGQNVDKVYVNIK
ncbi:glycoside hydrolase family 2 TIM barrel-domain containing protein [Chitinophaga sp. Cy-1792]|uniref:glycoside hydrolase family 2 protein n=1 Tax=Chitinophaga sp. Cy-1792 TaxID=2608339 RepID=UPI00142060AC|nr:glycoside hydrolase family 2 TIM barrel-domain containing protein [Chitinophaga sp. Cy-1792]NIG55536.1 glycosyl hydrolase [Chitinophaga sp. Cy-1792]